ncbi:hypothetical protein [Modestobacter sp. NPDC049651]|uniref:hypothetical protein n=1 Tax=unclassified Modestobacter TaxID=2643866 RepID=UPI0033ED07FC
MTDTTSAPRASRMRVARSRGAVSGLVLVVLGAWGALAPFIGPLFDFAYTPDRAWTWTSGRFWLEVLPGAAAVVGGLLLLTTANRAVGVFAGYLAAAAGAWFVVGPTLGRLWGGPEGAAGTPVGSTSRQVWEQISFFDGLGAVILFFAALALGRFTVRSLRDVRAAERHARGRDDDATGRRHAFAGNRTAAQDRDTVAVGRDSDRTGPGGLSSGGGATRAGAPDTPQR